MTRIAVLADIHGNMPALEAVIEHMRQHQPDHVVVAGDVVNWGPFAVEVFDRVVSEGWSVIRGNHEYYVLNYGTSRSEPGSYGNERWALTAWTKEALGDARLRRMGMWPDVLHLRLPNTEPLLIVHATAHSNSKHILPGFSEADVAEWFAGTDETTIITAHTHYQLDCTIAGRHLINPGAVGFPLDGHRDAAYALLDSTADGWVATFERVPYDSTPLEQRFIEYNLLEKAGATARLILEEVRQARMAIRPYMEWRQREQIDTPMTIAEVEMFLTAHPQLPTILEWNPPQ